MAELGKSMLLLGLVIALAGLAIWAFNGIGLLGRLPGDFAFRRGPVTIYFPLTTCILISVVLSLLLLLLRR